MWFADECSPFWDLGNEAGRLRTSQLYEPPTNSDRIDTRSCSTGLQSDSNFLVTAEAQVHVAVVPA